MSFKHFLSIPEILSFVYNDVNSERSVEHSELRIWKPSRRGSAFKVSFLTNNSHDNCSKKARLDYINNCETVQLFETFVKEITLISRTSARPASYVAGSFFSPVSGVYAGTHNTVDYNRDSQTSVFCGWGGRKLNNFFITEIF